MRLGRPVRVAWFACAVASLSMSPTWPGGCFGVSSAAAANAFINVIDNAITLTPTATDYGNDYVERTGATGIRVDVKSNSPTGLVLYVKCVDAAPQIALADFLIRTLSPPGTGGTSMAVYTAVTATDQALWSTGVPQGPFMQLNIDVRVKNLFSYTDAIGGAATGFTDNLSFTVISQ